MEAYCVRAYSDALEVIPFTLAENAGLNPICTVTKLRNWHAQGDKMAGINVRKVSLQFLFDFTAQKMWRFGKKQTRPLSSETVLVVSSYLILTL